MAGINMEMVMTDKVSPALLKMTKTLNGLMAAMSKADSSFHGVFDSGELQSIGKEIVANTKLTEKQLNKVKKLQHDLLSKERQRKKLENELANAESPISKRSKEVADVKSKLKFNDAERKRLEDSVKFRTEKLKDYNAAATQAEKDYNNKKISAHKRDLIVKGRDAYKSSIQSDAARVNRLVRQRKGLEEDLTKAEATVGRLLQERSDKEHKINGLKAEEAVLADKISGIYEKAQSDAENRVQANIKAIEKEMGVVDKLEAANLAAGEKANVAKKAEFNKYKEEKREELTQQLALNQAQQRYGKSIERAKNLYAEANQKVAQLSANLDKNNKAQVAEFNAAKQVAAERGKILNSVEKLRSIQERINYLEYTQTGDLKTLTGLYRQQEREKRKIAQSGRQIKTIESNARAEVEKHINAQKRLNKEKQKTVKSSNQVWAALKRGTTAYLSAQSVLGVINTSDNLIATKGRLDVMNDGKTSTDELMNMIYVASMRSRANYLDTAASVSKLAIQAGNLFTSNGNQNNAAIVKFMENYNKIATISQATEQQKSAAMLQIIQALSSGELRGEELRSVLENMPVVAQYVAKELTNLGDGFFKTLPKKLQYIAKDGKVATNEILKLGHEGLISAQILRDSVLGATEDLNEKMKKMPYTWGQVWTIFKNAALKAFEPVLNGISAILKNEKFLEFANGLGRALVTAGRLAYPVFNALGSVIGWVYDKVKGVYNFIKRNFSWIAPMILGITAALGVMYIAINAVAWATAIANSVTKAWTAVQAAFNAVMAMNPVAWVIIAIIALIAVIYIVIAVINKCCETSISATGVIAGAFAWLGTAIYDVIIFALKLVITVAQEIVNRIVDAAEWIYNAFNGGFTGWIGGVQNALWTFVNWALQLIKPLIEVWDKIKGTNYSSSLQSKVDSKLNATKSKNYKEFGRIDLASKLEYANPNEWYKKGYNAGKALDDKVSSFFDFSEYTKGIDEDKVNEFYKALTGGFDNPASSGLNNPALDKIDNIAKNTGDTAKNTSKQEEDFSYLRELAEREAINKYTLTDLKIDMTNNNNISNGVDEDNMMKRLAKELSRAVLTTAESITPW